MAEYIANPRSIVEGSEVEISCGAPFTGRTGPVYELSDPGGCQYGGREPEDGR